ncbi:MAG TPA: WcaI family glycosyltransferase [Steroidobacteraceae bacterium]|nr:WcaI family glycosyltransferase [Steroidobacteraceae bacterium]
MKCDSKRLLVVALNYAPEKTGIGKYVGEMTEWLAARDVAVRVVTAPPYYPEWSVKQGYCAHRYRTEWHAGSKVYRCPVWVPRNPRGMTRLLHLLSFAISSFPVILWQALAWRPDVIFVVEPPLGAAPGARLAAKLCGASSWLHVQDLEVDAAFELGLLRTPLLRRLTLAVERWLLRGFSHVSNISEAMGMRLEQKGVERQRMLFFPNWVDTEMIRPMERQNALRTELAIEPRTRVVLYSGNMGEKQGLDLILQVARRFDNEADVLFLLCGDGAVRERIGRAARGLRNVRLIPLQPLARLNELLNLADVHLLPQRTEATDLVLPSKLTAMMASGRPVVAAARGGSDVARFAGKGGLVVAPGDVSAFDRAIRRLLSDGTLSRRLGAAGRACALHHWERDSVLRRTFTQLPAFAGLFADAGRDQVAEASVVEEVLSAREAVVHPELASSLALAKAAANAGAHAALRQAQRKVAG